jgi:hypothetical protein
MITSLIWRALHYLFKLDSSVIESLISDSYLDERRRVPSIASHMIQKGPEFVFQQFIEQNQASINRIFGELIRQEQT